jgi:uncharacterized protein (TIGR03435 family)
MATFCSAFGAGLVLLCRTQAAPLEFEVASVKVSKIGNGVRGGCHGIDSVYGPTELASAPPLGRCVITAGRLSHLIGIAFDLHSMNLIKDAPVWVNQGFDRFNIEARAENPASTTEHQLLEMLQTLLIDRFQLKFHRETVDKPGFALVIAKKGPKLQESKDEEVATTFNGSKGKPEGRGPISLNARKYSMPMLASLLTNLSPDPVIDKTGLTGLYDFKLEWDESAGPSLFSAVTDQLGLHLDSQKVPVSLFVIDSAQKPTDN